MSAEDFHKLGRKIEKKMKHFMEAYESISDLLWQREAIKLILLFHQTKRR